MSAEIHANPRSCLGQDLGSKLASRASRLTARTVAGFIKPGRHGDGQGLYLSISHNGGRRWVWLYRWDGRTRELGLARLAPSP